MTQVRRIFRRGIAAGIVLAIPGGGACALDTLGLIDRSCPCIEGYNCVSNLCVPSGGESNIEGGGAESNAHGDARAGVDSADAAGGMSSEAGADTCAAFEAGSDDASPPPSCAPGGLGMTNCGVSNESCCTSLEVTGGTYDRTYVNDGDGPTQEADPATISAFRLDKYLVTVGRFRQFVDAWNGGAGYQPTAGSGKHTHLNGGQGLENSVDPGTYETGWDATNWNNASDIDPTNSNLACQPPSFTWTNTVATQENLPMVCANWWESYAFCIWDGGFLPSEAEWEYAAAGGGGGNGQREYPWGSTAPGTANQYAIYNFYYTGNPTDMAPVGYASQGAGNWGQFDLAGEAYEWNLDWYATYANPCTDCAYLTTASTRVIRGGDFGNTTSFLLPPNRNFGAPTDRHSGIGFRCARTP